MENESTEKNTGSSKRKWRMEDPTRNQEWKDPYIVPDIIAEIRMLRSLGNVKRMSEERTVEKKCV